MVTNALYSTKVPMGIVPTAAGQPQNWSNESLLCIVRMCQTILWRIRLISTNVVFVVFLQYSLGLMLDHRQALLPESSVEKLMSGIGPPKQPSSKYGCWELVCEERVPKAAISVP